jgi:hypothetical protein
MKNHCILFIAFICLSGCGREQKRDENVSSFRRFFSDSSFWNQAIPDNAEIDPKSGYYISLLEKDPHFASFGINLRRYTIPVYETDSATEYFKIKRHYLSGEEKQNWKTSRETFGHGKEFDSLPVPVPRIAIPDTASDMHLSIIDWNSKTAWDMWGAKKLADGTWESNTGMRYPIDGPGVFDTSWFKVINGESIHFHGPGRAAGVPIIAGLIMYDEVKSGKVEHRIAAASRFNAFQEFVFPATWTDGMLVGGIPEGAVIQLDPQLDLSVFDLLPGEKAVAVALQKYGMVIVDWAGGNVIYGENLNNDKKRRSWDGVLRDWDGGIIKIPLKHYRVLKLKNVIKKGDAKRMTTGGIPGIE